MSTDVLGRLVEVVAGKPLGKVLSERIFEPLGMDDTSFNLPHSKIDRLTELFQRQDDSSYLSVDPPNDQSTWVQPVTLESGGGGLVSTASDYFKFAEMLRCLGALNGSSILGRKTAEYMMRNHCLGELTSQVWGNRFLAKLAMTVLVLVLEARLW